MFKKYFVTINIFLLIGLTWANFFPGHEGFQRCLPVIRHEHLHGSFKHNPNFYGSEYRFTVELRTGSWFWRFINFIKMRKRTGHFQVPPYILHRTSVSCSGGFSHMFSSKLNFLLAFNFFNEELRYSGLVG